MRTNKTSTGPKALFRNNLNKQLRITENFKQNGQKVPSAFGGKKADSPWKNFVEILKFLQDNSGLVLVILVFGLIGTFIFVWYTALKRNL